MIQCAQRQALFSGLCELEKNSLRGKVKMITAYLGELVQE